MEYTKAEDGWYFLTNPINGNFTDIMGDTGMPIATITHYSKDPDVLARDEANARLIAKAPEMAEFIKGQHEDILALGATPVNTKEDYTRILEAYINKYADKSRRILSEIEGETKEETFICPWCNEEKPISVKCSKGYCRSCAGNDF